MDLTGGALLFTAGLILNGVTAYMTAATRRIPEFHLLKWYILGGFCLLATI